jgi:formimidoylglutamate deiminase
MASTLLHFDSALLPDGWRNDVSVAVDASGSIAEVSFPSPLAGEGGSRGRPDEGGGERFRGLAVPGVPNVHSHAHQRAMAGLAERSGRSSDSFWTWREAMYGFALRMTPEDLEAVAAQLYVEMLKSGFAAVGEFQYLHHQPDGAPYAEPAEMSLRCLAAAESSGIAVTMLPTLVALAARRERRASGGFSTASTASSASSTGSSGRPAAIRCAGSASRLTRYGPSRANC